MADFLPALPHGPITEAFPDVFVVRGTFGFAPGLSIPRSMMVIRQGDELTLVNSIRLSAEGEAALEALGRVAHVVRIGAFHDADDPWMMHRFRPALWAPPGTRHRGGIASTHDLVPGASATSRSRT
jgi:hypothetical protein